MPTKLALTSLLIDIVKATVQVLLETHLANIFFSRFGNDNAVDWLVGNWGICSIFAALALSSQSEPSAVFPIGGF